MHPLRTLREWYIIVHWTLLIKNQDVNTRYLGSYPPFWMVFKMAAMKKDKMPILCHMNLLPSGMLTFLSRTSIFKTLNFISGIKRLMYSLNIVLFNMAVTLKYILAYFH